MINDLSVLPWQKSIGAAEKPSILAKALRALQWRMTDGAMIRCRVLHAKKISVAAATAAMAASGASSGVILKTKGQIRF